MRYAPRGGNDAVPPGRTALAEDYRMGSARIVISSKKARLSASGARNLRKNGCAIVRNLVSRKLREDALREINQLFGLARAAAGGVNEEVMESPAVMALLYASPLWSLAESLLGRGKVAPVTEAQAVLRFPRVKATPWTPEVHLDEFVPRYPGDGVTVTPSFTMLACVLLSDLPAPDSGNFAYSPGSHLAVAEHLRRKGTTELEPELPARLDLPPLVPFTGKAGDVALCHYLLAHDRQDNLAPHIRYAAFFRLIHSEHRARRAAVLRDPWLEWPGLR